MRSLSILVFFIAIRFLSLAETVVPRLSPLSSSIEKERVGLAGTWLFNTSPDERFWLRGALGNDWKPIEVPGEWVMQGFEVEKGATAGYSRTFSVPAAWKGKRIKLRCNAIYSESRLYINGKEAAYHIGGFTAFETDVTGLIRFGQENRIDVAVVCETVADSLASGSRYAVHPLGGITRDLYLFALPERNISMFHVSTAFDSTYTKAVLKVETELANEASVSSGNELSLSFHLRDAQGKTVRLAQDHYPVGVIEAGKVVGKEVSFDIENPEKWNPEHPYLYTLTCRLTDGGKLLHETSRKVGFRQIEVRGNRMFVNGMPIKLRGVCRHEVMPLRGRSVSEGLWRKDVELFRLGNVNYIRTSHYPPDEALLEACDELGMFVEVEAPFCWAHETKVPEDKMEAVLVNQHVEMVNLNRSHPSVLMWSMGNESNLYTEYFKRAAEVVKRIDPTRPRIFSQWGPNADKGELEVTNHHYPGPKGPEKYRNYKRPVVFDEFCHLNAYNRFELSADPGVRSMWGELLDRMWNDMYHSEGVLGGAIWAGIDDTFFLPGGRAVGYGTWGPLDGWRREKPEYWGMKKAYSPVRLELRGNMDKDGKVMFDVENRYNFTNLSACEIQWKAGNLSGTVTADIAARESGVLEINLPEKARKESFLSVVVTGAQGFVVDEYKFKIQPDRLRPLSPKAGQAIRCEETAEAIVVTSLSGTYKVSKRDGLLEDYRQVLMLLPLNSTGRGIQMVGDGQDFEPYNPVCTNWVATSIEKREEEDQIEIVVRGQYQEAEGEWRYRILSTGEVSIAYDFKVLKEVSPRQIGVVLSLPATYTQLEWKRKGYWSVYPENHIGALEGKAELFNESLAISGMAGPDKQPSVDWCLDQTASGSNMFRSTKEHIYEATLADRKSGISVKVLSDGTQSVRCWKDKQKVRMLVADYNNAGKEGFLSPHIEYAYRTLKYGERVNGEFLFIRSVLK